MRKKSDFGVRQGVGASEILPWRTQTLVCVLSWPPDLTGSPSHRTQSNARPSPLI